MANPQCENGHIDIANEIMEALAKIRLSGQEWQCLCVIFRKTYGWHKKEDWISLSQFTSMTNIKKPNIVRSLNSLIDKRIIIKNDKGVIKFDKGHGVSYQFNKDYDKWRPLSKTIKIKKTFIKNDKRPLSKTIPTKETSTKETKKNIYIHTGEFKNVKLTPEEMQKLKERYKDYEDRIETLSLYLKSKGDKYKSHYATILNWERKENKEKKEIKTMEYPLL